MIRNHSSQSSYPSSLVQKSLPLFHTPSNPFITNDPKPALGFSGSNGPEHSKFEQIDVAGHTLPHPPQLNRSDLKSTQPPLHANGVGSGQPDADGLVEGIDGVAGIVGVAGVAGGVEGVTKGVRNGDASTQKPSGPILSPLPQVAGVVPEGGSVVVLLGALTTSEQCPSSSARTSWPSSQ